MVSTPSASAEAVYELTITRVTPIPKPSGDTIVYEINFQCAAVDEPQCIDSHMSIPLPQEIEVAGLVPHPYIEGWTFTRGVGLEIDLVDSVPTGSSVVFSLELSTENGTTPNLFSWTVPVTLTATNTETVTAQSDGQVTAQAQISVEKNLNGSPAVPFNTTVRYWISVCNPSDPEVHGNLFLETATLVDPLPQYATFVAASAGGVYDNGTRTVTWANLTDVGRDKCVPDAGGEYWVDVTYTTADPNNTAVQPNYQTSITNTATVTATAIGAPDAPLTDSDSLIHGFIPVAASGVIDKQAGTHMFGESGPQANDTYAGNFLDYAATGYSEVRYIMWMRNTGNVPLATEVIDPLPCISNNHTSLTPGNLCPDPAFVPEQIVFNSFSAPGTYLALDNLMTVLNSGWTPTYVTNLGTTGNFVRQAGANTVNYFPPALPAGQRIAEIRFPYHPLLTAAVSSTQTRMWDVLGYMVDDIPAGTMPDGEVVHNHMYADLYFNGQVVGTAVDIVAPVGIRAPQKIIGISKDLRSAGNNWLYMTNLSATPLTGVVMTDLIPAGYKFVAFTQGSLAQWNVEIIDNYAGTGRQLLRFTLRPGQQIAPGAYGMNLIYTTNPPSSAAGGLPGSTTNTVQAFLNGTQLNGCSEHTNFSNASNSAITLPRSSDPNDLDGDGLTTGDQFCQGTGFFSRSGTVALLESEKFVKGNLDTTFEGFPTVGSVTAGGTGQYRMVLTNRGNVGLNNISVYDIFPYVGDSGVSDTQLATARQTQWAPVLAGPITAPADATVEYSTSTNPCRNEVAPSQSATCVNDWSTTPPSPIGNTKAIRLRFPGVTLAVGATRTFEWSVSVPSGVTPGQVAWNSFAVAANRTDTNAALLSTEPPKVGLAVPASDISLDKKVNFGHGPVSVAVGDLVYYDITVKHDGTITTNANGSVTYSGAPSTATGVKVTDLLPAGVELVPGSVDAWAGGSGTLAGTFDEATMVWSIGEMPPGSTSTLRMRVKVLQAGTITNYAEVTANGVADVDSTPDNDSMTEDDDDTATIIAGTPALQLRKLVETERDSGVFIEADATDNLTGLYAQGERVRYRFIVTNLSAFRFTNVVVTDPLVGSLCPPMTITTLNAYASMTFNCDWPLGWPIGTTVNTATVTGTYNNQQYTDTDPATVVVPQPGVTIEKHTNGVDADTPDLAPEVEIGDAITWTYAFTNTGAEPLTDLVLTDDMEGALAIDAAHCSRSDQGDVAADLPVGVTVTCTYTGVASGGLYANTGKIVGFGVVSQAPANDTDPSHYLAPVAAPHINVEKATNGVDADLPADAVVVAPGSTVTWTYVVTNDGNAPLFDVALADDLEGIIDLATCTRSDQGDPTAMLPAGVSITCSLTGTAQEGLYGNIANVTAVDQTNADVADDDPSHYLGAVPGIDVEKAVNGSDADTEETAVQVAAGSLVTWTYVITNTGNVALSNLTLADDQVGSVTVDAEHCTASPDSTLALLLPGDDITCIFTGSAVAGAYVNTALVGGVDPLQQQVSDSDSAHSFGVAYDLALVKTLPGGQSFKKGAPINFTITVKNQGNVDSGPITVQDVVPAGLGIVTASDGGLGVGQVVTWEIANLAPGEIKILTITVTVVDATLTTYENFAEVVADGADQYDVPGLDVEDEDSVPDADVTNDTLVETDDVNIDLIPGDSDDHDHALLDPAKVKSDNPKRNTIPSTGGNAAPLLWGATGVVGFGLLALAATRRRRLAP